MRLIIAFFFAVVSQLSLANPYDYQVKNRFVSRNLSIEQGLSQSVVNQSLEDELGFLWFATEDGLNRFDGYEFLQFHHDLSDPHSLPNNYLTALGNAGQGDIWVGHTRGLALYQARTRQFIEFDNGDKEIGWVNQFSRPFDASTSYVASENGLFKLSKLTQRYEQVSTAEGELLDEEFLSIALSGQLLYAMTSDCLYLIELKSNNHQRHCVGESIKKAGSSSQIEFHQIVLVDQMVWIASNQGLLLFDPETSQLRKPRGWLKPLSEGLPIQNSFTRGGLVWFNSGDQLITVDPKRQLIQQRRASDLIAGKHFSAKIVSLYQDSQENFWVGIYGKGLVTFTERQTAFGHLLDETQLSDEIPSNVIHSIIKDNSENLWMASFGADLLQLNLMTGQVSRHRLKDGLNNVMLYSLFYDNQNRLWVGTSMGLYLFNPEKKKLIDTAIQFENLENESLFILTVYQDRLGDVWVGTDKGLFQLDQSRSDKDHLVLRDYSLHLPISFRNESSIITSIWQDLEGNYWVGGYGGLIEGNFESGAWRHFVHDSQNRHSLSSNAIQQIFQDHGGHLWIATDDGLNRVMQSDSGAISFQRVTTAEGLPSNAIYNIAEDRDHKLIIATNKGLVSYSEIKDRIQTFDHRDGISSNEFNTHAVYEDLWGLIYLGSINGVTQIWPENIASIKQNAKIRVIDLQIDGVSVDFPHLPIKETISLKDDQSLTIKFANLDYFLADSQVYRYMIKGFNDRWYYLNKDRIVSLSSIDKGDYWLVIQSKANSGAWEDNELIIPLQVRADFLSGTNVVILVVLTAIFIIIASVFGQRYYFRRLMDKREYQVKLESLRLRELRQENERLKSELTLKGADLSEKNKELEIIKKRLASQSYRDVVTNLIKIDYLYKLADESASVQELQWRDYQFYAVLKVTDSALIEMKHGVLASNELHQQIALEIKRHLPAEAHIFVAEVGTYHIISRKENSDYLLESLQHLRTRIISSQFKLANVLVVRSDAELEVMQLSSMIDHPALSITDIIEFMNLVFTRLREKGIFRGTGIVLIPGQFKPEYLKVDANLIERLLETGELVIAGR